MKSDTLLTLGILGVAGYAAYKVIPNLTSPLSYLNTISQEKSKLRRKKSEAITPTEIQAAVTTSKTKAMKAVATQEQKKLRYFRNTAVQEARTVNVTSKTNALRTAAQKLQPERTQRYEEYGTGTKEWFGKMFMPTTSIIKERRKALRHKIVAPINYIRNKVGNITSHIRSYVAPPKPKSKVSSFSTAAPTVKPAVSSTIQKIISSKSSVPAALSSLRAAVKNKVLPISSWVMRI